MLILLARCFTVDHQHQAKMALQQRMLRDALTRHLRRRPMRTRDGLSSTVTNSISNECKRWVSSNSNNTSRGGMKYVTSDTIDKRLLQGLTAASDESRPVNLIQDKEGAKRVLSKILELGPAHFHACDTEVGQIDIKAVGPVGNGKVRNASALCCSCITLCTC